MRSAQKAALILTTGLTDGSFEYVDYKPIDQNVSHTIQMAHMTLGASSTQWAKHLQNSLQQYSPSAEPVHVYSGKRIVGAAYHHGAEYTFVATGSLNRILQFCDATENERESLITYTRQQLTRGNVCFAVASIISTHPIKSLSELNNIHHMTLAGVIVAKPKLYPNTLKHLDDIKKKYAILHYVSTDNEYMTAATAIQAHLMKPTDAVVRSVDDINPSVAQVAALSANAFTKLIQTISYDHTFKKC